VSQGGEVEMYAAPREPSPSELAGMIERNRQETERNRQETAADFAELKAAMAASTANIIAQLDRYLLIAVYDADNRAREIRDTAQDGQIRDLKDEVTSARRGNRTALLGAIGSFVGALLLVAFDALIKRGGG
jgi:hypothetical protein